MGEKKTKLMLYSTLLEIEVEVGVELGKSFIQKNIEKKKSILLFLKFSSILLKLNFVHLKFSRS